MPDGWVEVVRLGVVIGIGQQGVTVVVEVGVAEAAIWDQQAKGGKDQRLV